MRVGLAYLVGDIALGVSEEINQSGIEVGSLGSPHPFDHCRL